MRTLLGSIAAVCLIGLWLLGIGIYLFTLYLAYLTSFPSLLLTLFFSVLRSTLLDLDLTERNRRFFLIC
jgi:hypothetical protein